MGLNMISRRALLSTAALGGVAILVAGCSADQIAQFEAQWASVAGQIQSTVSVAAGYIPTIESIAATAAGLFGPQYAAIVAASTTAINQVVAALVAVVANLSPPASARLSARLRGSSPNVPVLIGVTKQGVQVAGWKA
jgi:hypothetical protein